MLRLILQICSVTLLFIWNVQPITSCLYGSNHNFGELMPAGDNFFKVNTTPKPFRCKLHRHNITFNNTTIFATSSDLRVSVNGRDLKTRRLDDLTVEFNVSDPKVNDSGYYICKALKVMICMANYQFGYDPLPVKNFTCISEGFQNLICTWNLTYNPVPTNYTLSYMPDYTLYYPALGCPQNISKANRCEWTLDTPQVYYRNSLLLNFKITGVNVLGTWTKEYSLNHHELIRAGVPDKPKVLQVGKTSALVNWTYPNMMPLNLTPPILYELSYKADNYDAEFTAVQVGIDTFEKQIELIPNLDYTIRLRCRVINATKLWSDNATLSLKMEPDVPYFAPVIINQSFDVKNFEDKGYRTVTLYWQGVDNRFCNGDTCTYVISASIPHAQRAAYHEVKEVEKKFVTFSQLSLADEYRFEIKMKNELGESKNSTHLVLPKKNNEMPNHPNEVAASKDDDGYNVTWEPSNSNDVISYTVAKCTKSQSSQGNCDGRIDWVIVPANQSHLFFHVRDQSKFYNFAVAATSKFNASSGLTWVPCIVPKNRKLDKIKKVRVYNVSATELKVTENLECRASYSVVKSFSIMYSRCQGCNVGCVDPKIEIRSPATKSEYILDNLKPFTWYSIKMAPSIDSSDGLSEYSDPVCESTNPAAPADPPHNVVVEKITANSAMVSWTPPIERNGIINQYLISGAGPEDVVVIVPAHLYGKNYTLNTTLANLTGDHTYYIKINACVNGLCTPTPQTKFTTKIGEPGGMLRPDVSYLNRTAVTIEWQPPKLPNGPIHTYIIEWRPEHAGENGTYLHQLNVSGKTTKVELDVDCGDDQQGTQFLFYVRAVNEVNETWLYGPASTPGKETLCSLGQNNLNAVAVGLIIGAALALVPLCVILYTLVRWMRKKFHRIRDVPEVELPPGLINSPHSNPTSYDNFKNGLKCNPDVSPKPAYGRLDSFISNDDSFKNRHGSGTSQFSATSTDELISKQKIITEKAKRNPSGDSSGCGSTGGHDSLSSSLTHRTNLSSDSGNEADIKNPPSPEVARIGEVPEAKLEEKSLNVSCVSGSKDSGVDKGDDSDEKSKSPVSPYSQFSSCVDSSNKALGSYSPPAPYSKFGMEPSCYVPISRGRNLQLYGHNLANSEPSINEMDEVNPYSCVCAESKLDGTVLYPTLAGQYSKLGLSRSIQDILGYKSFVLDKNEALMNIGSRHEEGAVLPYSRFGMRRMESPPNVKDPYITVGLAFSMTDKNPKELLRQKENQVPWLPDVLLRNKMATPGKIELLDEGFENSDTIDKDNMAYSKIGLGEADYVADKNFNLAIKPFEAPPSTSKSVGGYVGLDELKIFPISQLVANSEKNNDLEIVEIENDTDQRLNDVGGIAPYSCIIPSFKDGLEVESQEPFSLQNLDKNYTPPSYDDLDQTFKPAKLTPSANGYVSQDVFLQNSKRNLDRTSFDSLNPSNELLPKPELKESRLPDVNVKRSNGYVTIRELPSICGGKDVRFDMPVTDV